MNIYDLKINSSWDDFVKSSKYLNDMLGFINSEKDICPVKEKVFRFLECDLKNAKCIILGMDPYPSTYDKNGVETPVATGRSFEVANVEKFTDKYRQTSLANIFKALWYLKYDEIISINEIREKLSYREFKYLNIHDWFDAMEKEGVLFLNSTLTTKINHSNVHTKIWEDFMNELFSFIAEKNKGIKWLIWGENARNRIRGIVNSDMIVYTCHPATRVNNTFVKDCTFQYIKNVNWV